MAKYKLLTLEQIEAFKATLEADNKILERGDIIVHTPFNFATMQGLMKRHYDDSIKLFYAGPGTEVFTRNGLNTSVVESVTITNQSPP